MIMRGYSYKLLPTPSQGASLKQWVGVCRVVYNVALEQRNTWWRQYRRQTGKSFNFASQGQEIKDLRREFDWIAQIPCNALHRVLRDLDSAFSAFFAGRANYPTFRRKGQNESFRLAAKDVSVKSLNAKWAMIRLPKIGWIKFRQTRAMAGEVKSITVASDATGWHVAITCAISHEPPAPMTDAVGIDRGVTTTIALSTGDLLALPESIQQIEIQKRRAQRVVARRKKGSKRRRCAQMRVARLQTRQVRIRRDFHHRASLDIARRFGVAVLEDLSSRKMTASAKGTVAEPGRNVRQKAGLNRAILNAGWHQFQTILTYKMEERGGHVVTVPARFTSQTCAACGVIDARSRESQAVFRCVECGHSDHADINAAKEILRRGSTSSLRAEGSGHGPVEARTIAVREHGSNLALV